MALLVFLSVFGLALMGAKTQQPKPCVVPPLLTGDFSMVANDGGVMFNGHISYDSLGQRMRINNYGVSLNGTRFIAIDQIMLFNEEVYYEIDWIRHSCIKKGLDGPFIPMQVPHDASFMGQGVYCEIDWSTFSCQKTRLEATFHPMQVPQDATFFGQVFLGSSSGWGMGVLVNNWYGTFSSDGLYTFVTTEIGCLPITTMHHTEKTGSTIISMFNWVMWAADSDFQPPPFCQEALAEAEDAEEADTFFTAIRSLAQVSPS